jgi:hypothetical protein
MTKSIYEKNLLNRKAEGKNKLALVSLTLICNWFQCCHTSTVNSLQME